MARKPRVHFPGALYHVMARGNQGQAIFTDDADRRRYLDLLQESQRRHNYRVYAYVLMGNHNLSPHSDRSNAARQGDAKYFV
jgi:putative transposase